MYFRTIKETDMWYLSYEQTIQGVKLTVLHYLRLNRIEQVEEARVAARQAWKSLLRSPGPPYGLKINPGRLLSYLYQFLAKGRLIA